MIDIQNQPDARGIALPDVGIRGLRYPILTGDRDDRVSVVASLEVGVDVPADRKGTHMSRLVQTVVDNADDLTVAALPTVGKHLLHTLLANRARIRIAFPLAVPQPTPVTGLRAMNVHDAHLELDAHNDATAITVGVTVVATSLCPCSKAISDYGAHNQRSRISIAVQGRGASPDLRLPTFRQSIATAEAAASCATVPLLKRPDERHVTMAAYDHPVFVEDIVRDVVLRLQDMPGPGRLEVRVVNEESIHAHDAYAFTQRVLGSTAPF